MVNVVNGEGVDGDDAGVSRPPCSAAEFCRTFDVTLILAESLANRKTHHGPHSRVQVSLQSSLVPSPFSVYLSGLSGRPRWGLRGTRILQGILILIETVYSGTV